MSYIAPLVQTLSLPLAVVVSGSGCDKSPRHHPVELNPKEASVVAEIEGELDGEVTIDGKSPDKSVWVWSEFTSWTGPTRPAGM